MLVHSVGVLLSRINSPLAYPWRCLAGDSARTLIRRLARIRRVMASILYINPRPALPVRVQIETTDHCNLKCIMCTRELMSDMNSSAITLETFRRVVDEIQPFYVTLNGLGEPLLDPSIFDKLALLHERGIVSSMPTNGTYVRRGNVDKLAANLPDILQLSIDGATRASFEGVRKLGDFEQITGNYRAIATRRATGHSRSNTAIRILCALQKKNLFDYRQMYRLWKSIPKVTFSLVPVFQYDAEGGRFTNVTPSKEEVERLQAEIDVAISEADSDEEKRFYQSWRDTAGRWLDTSNYKVGAIHTGACTIPWYSTYIDAKGRVYPCCYLTDTNHVMGNVKSDSFVTIWHGDKYRDFRRRLVEDRANLQGCRTCPRNDQSMLKTLARLRPILPAVEQQLSPSASPEP
jgi:radical SAM protein with 4Fe4S-binding SPASM domain